jgi:Flp pilus assembly protein TadG
MKRKHRERGTTLLETVILIGVLLSIVFGMIDFGRAMYTYAFIAQIARQGARWAIVRGAQCSVLDNCNAGQAQIQNYVRTLSEGVTNSSAIVVAATWPSCPPGNSGNSPGCVVSVNVTYPFTFVLKPFLPNVTINMSSTSRMVIAQ